MAIEDSGGVVWSLRVTFDLNKLDIFNEAPLFDSIPSIATSLQPSLYLEKVHHAHSSLIVLSASGSKHNQSGIITS